MEKNLYELTKEMWIKEKSEDLSLRWAGELECALEQSKRIAKFHQWKPLKVFTSLSAVRKPKPVFSLRYRGQEVANLIADKDIKIEIKAKTASNTLKQFGLISKTGEYNWSGNDAKVFRKQFIEYDKTSSKDVEMKSDEAWLQSIVFEKMAKTADAGLYSCQPVLFDRFPFQCPVPISGSSGVPKKTKGNLDILARRGQGNTHPAIWELKKPQKCETAFEQAYIYGVTFALMLRGKGGDVWYKNMNFTKKLNQHKLLTIDIILMITKDREKELTNHLSKFTSPMELVNENVILKPFVAYYEWNKIKGTVEINEPLDLTKYLSKK